MWHTVDAPRVAGFVLMTLILVSAPARAMAADSLTIDAGKQFAYAEAAFSTGDFERAINEYQRFLHFFPDDPQAETAMFRIGTGYFNLRRYRDADDAFRRIIGRRTNTGADDRAHLMMAECRVRLDDPDSAVAGLQQLIRGSKDPAVTDEAWHRMAWLFIEQSSWDRAAAALGNVSPQGSDKFRLAELSPLLARADGIRRKNPKTAGILSVVPGGGHLYCGRSQDALIAFVLNTALIACAWESFDQDLPWLGGVISFVELGMFSGTVYSGINSAHQYNRRSSERFVRNLKSRMSPRVSMGPSPGGFQVHLEYQF